LRATNTHATTQVIQTKKIYTGVWIKRRQPPSKISKNFYWNSFLFIDFNTGLYFKLGHVTFICDRRSEIYHTMKQFLAKNT
jgi:hypothetical protein